MKNNGASSAAVAVNSAGLQPRRSMTDSPRVRALIGASLFALAVLLPPDQAIALEGPTRLASAWEQRHADIEAARRLLLGSKAATNEVALAEAYRYLGGLVSLNDTRSLYFSDPAFPHFVEVVAPQNDAEFSNPDTYYLAAEISDRYSYRIRGRLGTVNQTTIGSYAVSYDKNPSIDKPMAGERATNTTLVADDEGNFELIVSKERVPAQNWIPLIEDATTLVIYQIHSDWEKERKGYFAIERIDDGDTVPGHADAEQVARRVEASGKRVLGTVGFWLKQSENHLALPVNEMSAPRTIQVASLGSLCARAHYHVPEGKALILEFPAPEQCGYWGMALYNAWDQMLDFSHRQTSLNNSQAVRDRDGRYRLVLAQADPGIPNWLDIGAHPEGVISWRVTTTETPLAPRLRLVDLDALTRSLPADARWVDAAACGKNLRLRQRATAMRYTN